MSTHGPKALNLTVNPKHRIAIVAARFNDHIVGKLLDGAQSRLKELGVSDGNINTFRVPGAFELPVAARVALEKYDAVICLGCVIRGETYHFETVANEAAAGIRQAGVLAGKPAIFGVLTVNTEEQAEARVGGSHSHAGVSAAEAAIEMLAVVESLRSR